jgi:hypothetical protein
MIYICMDFSIQIRQGVQMTKEGLIGYVFFLALSRCHEIVTKCVLLI